MFTHTYYDDPAGKLRIDRGPDNSAARETKGAYRKWRLCEHTPGGGLEIVDWTIVGVIFLPNSEPLAEAERRFRVPSPA